MKFVVSVLVNEKITDKAVYFLKFADKKTVINLSQPSDNDIIFGELHPQCIYQLNNTMELTFHPMIEQIESWGECEADSIDDFKKNSKEFIDVLQFFVKSLQID